MTDPSILARLRTLPRGLLPLYAGTIATRVGTFVVPYLTLYLAQHRGLSMAVTGRVIAAGGVGLLLGNLAGGWLADRIGRKPTILAALVLNVVGIACLGSGMSSALAYGLALAVTSMGAGMYTPAANAWIADLTRDRTRQLAYAVNYLCINVGMATGPLLGGLLAAASFGWLFVGDIATTVLCGAILLGTTAPPKTTAPQGPETRSWAAWRQPGALAVLAFCGASFFVIAPLMGLEYAVPLLVGTVFDQPLVLVGTVYTINAGCILVLGLFLERMLAGRDPVRMMVLAALLWAAGLGVLAWGFSVSALLLSTVVWTLGEMVGSVVVPTYVSQRVAPAFRGQFLALPDAMRSLASVVAPIALGWQWDAQGPRAVVHTLVAVPLLGATLYGLGWVCTRRR